MNAPGNQGYREMGKGVEGSEPEAGALHPGPIPSALFGAEGLPLHIVQMPPLCEVTETSHHTSLRQDCGVVYKTGN